MHHKLLEPETVNKSDVKSDRNRTLTKVEQRNRLHLNQATVQIKPEKGERRRPATVASHHNSPRSYVVDTGERRLRQNRVALRSDSRQSKNQGAHHRQQAAMPEPEIEPTSTARPSVPPNSRPDDTMQSGRQVKKPVKLNL